MARLPVPIRAKNLNNQFRFKLFFSLRILELCLVPQTESNAWEMCRGTHKAKNSIANNPTCETLGSGAFGESFVVVYIEFDSFFES